MWKVATVALLLFLSSCSPIEAEQEVSSTPPPTEVVQATPTPDADAQDLYRKEIVADISVYFHRDTGKRSNQHISGLIKDSLNMLPKHIQAAIKDIDVYIVNEAIKCPEHVGQLSVTAGCANSYDGWIELISPYTDKRVVVHEFGHIVGDMKTPRNTDMYSAFFSAILSSEPIGPTNYSRRYYKEDFAESFAIYVLAPKILKDGYPLRYEFFKELFEGKLS